MGPFTVSRGSVYWNKVCLSERDAERLLDLFQDLGDQPEARTAFLDLYEAHLAAGGIERCTSLRMVGQPQQYAAE
jgi:hypothetical protein